MSSPVPPETSRPRQTQADPARAPVSGSRRLGLLLILLILPVIAVCLPAIFVTLVFGQHPRVAAAPDEAGLRGALERNAAGVMPTPDTLAAEPIVITVRAEHVAARAARVTALAAQFGGTAAEGLPKAGEKDLYIDVPATGAAGFRGALTAASPPDGASAPAAVAGGPVEHLEVIVRAAADDE